MSHARLLRPMLFLMIMQAAVTAGSHAQTVPVAPPALFGVAADAWRIPDAGAETPAIFRQTDRNGSGQTKNVGLAVLYSLLLPGMGELYAGDYGTGKYLTAAEGALWLTLAAVDHHAGTIEDDARRYAALHASFSPDGKDDTYYVNVGNFNSIYDYNEQVLRDRDAYKLYDPDSPDYWKWDSEASRSLYRDQRVSADEMFNNTRFVVAAIAVNHVLSAINAARLVIARNRNAGEDPGTEIGARVLGGWARPHGIALSVTHTF